MKVLLSHLFCVLMAIAVQAQETSTKQLGKFGPADLALRTEREMGKELVLLYLSFQNAEAPSDAIDIGGVMLTDSVSAREFAGHLEDAVAHLGARRGKMTFEGRAYAIKAVAGQRRVALYGKGRFKTKYALLSEMQASKLAEAVRRNAGAVRD